jgi:hypothetical protein
MLKYQDIKDLLKIYERNGTLPDSYLIFFRDQPAPVKPNNPEQKTLRYNPAVNTSLDTDKLRAKHTSQRYVPDDETTQIEYDRVKKQIDKENAQAQTDPKNISLFNAFLTVDKSNPLKGYFDSIVTAAKPITKIKLKDYPAPKPYTKRIEIFDEVAYNNELNEIQQAMSAKASKAKIIDEENRQIEKFNRQEMRRFERETKTFDEYQKYTKKDRWDNYVEEDNGTILGLRMLKMIEETTSERIDDCLKNIMRINDELEVFYPKPDTEQLIEYVTPVSKRAEDMTGGDLTKMKFRVYEFNQEWKNLLGSPSRPFSAMVFGDAKSGKSFFCLAMAQYFTLYGDVLYIASEEGKSETTKRKIEITGANDVIISEASTLTEIIEALDRDKYQFCFIDSASHARIDVEHFQALKGRFPKTSFIAILQTTKDNRFLGEKEWVHDVQSILKLTNPAPNTTKIVCTGRFGNGEKIISY